MIETFFLSYHFFEYFCFRFKIHQKADIFSTNCRQIANKLPNTTTLKCILKSLIGWARTELLNPESQVDFRLNHQVIRSTIRLRFATRQIFTHIEIILGGSKLCNSKFIFSRMIKKEKERKQMMKTTRTSSKYLFHVQL